MLKQGMKPTHAGQRSEKFKHLLPILVAFSNHDCRFHTATGSCLLTKFISQ
jgi:hypothetical protein